MNNEQEPDVLSEAITLVAMVAVIPLSAMVVHFVLGLALRPFQPPSYLTCLAVVAALWSFHLLLAVVKR